MANFRPSVDLGNNILNAIRDFIDQASGSPNAGYIRIYSGTQPAAGGDALSGNTLLAELRFADPSGSNAAARALTFNAIVSDVAANATGTATWARILDGNGQVCFDCDVTATGGGGAITFATVSFVQDVQVDLTSFGLTIAGT
jgi:hypothetical protein